MVAVSISGPPSSGKTTLWRELKGKFGDSGCFVEDLPRRYLSALPREVAESDDGAFQHFITFQQLYSENVASSQAGLVVLDKSLVDVVAYWRVLVGQEAPRWVLDRLPGRYDMLLLCCPDDIVVTDELALRHKTIRSTLDGELRRVVREFSLPVKEISGTRQSRQSLSEEILRRTRNGISLL